MSVVATGTAAADATPPLPSTTPGAAATGKAAESPLSEAPRHKADRIDLGDLPRVAIPAKTRPVTPTRGENCEPTRAGSRERRAGAVQACVTISPKPAATAGKRALATIPPAAPAAADEGSCAITTPATWYYNRFQYCAYDLTVLYTLKDSNGRVLGTGTLSVSTGATLPAKGKTWKEQVRVMMTGATDAVTTLGVKFRAACSAGCTVTDPSPWEGKSLVKDQIISGTVEYASAPAPGTKLDFTTSYKLFVTSPGAQITDPNAAWSNPEKIRCDDDVRDTANGTGTPAPGCVVPSFMPVIPMGTLPNGSDAGAAAAGYLWGQRNLADGWGRDKPLTRAKNDIADRTARTCGSGGSKPFQERTDIVPTDSCGEFPFAATHEGGTDGAQCAEIIPTHSTGGWDFSVLEGGAGKRCVRAHVPLADKQAAEGQLSDGFTNQRVLEAEQFKVDISASVAEPQAACLRASPTDAFQSGNGWIRNTTDPVAHRNKNTTPPDAAGVRAAMAQACLGKVPGTGSPAVGDITGWQDAQQYARPYAAPGASAPYGLARCHLIANILGGKGQVQDGGQLNLVPCWQAGMNTGTPSMRTFEVIAQKAVKDGTIGPNDAIFYQVTPDYQDSTSTVPVGVTMTARIERADGSTQPLFPDVYIPNTKSDTGQLNLGN
ncbi:DNA/RNA non-specific endonuclease [Streptomyces sp. YS-3]|uniref:DNA/RNA non-specific endonuclease n=1 Tax=Streptomyces sp. YS-3 TaxID=3381352 RepID=UPI003862B01D